MLNEIKFESATTPQPQAFGRSEVTGLPDSFRFLSFTCIVNRDPAKGRQERKDLPMKQAAEQRLQRSERTLLPA